MLKHFLLIVVLFLVSCTSTATSAAPQSPQSTSTKAPTNTQIPTSTPIPEITIGVVEVDILNIREGPGTSYPTIGSLTKGEKFYVLGDVTNSTNNKWLLVSPSNNSFGWVIGEQTYVTVQKEIVDLSTYLIWQKNVDDAKLALITLTATP
ncbi:MAG: SH3 domain-containing protein [Chloroflexi bacterium]|nr:MAG: SH3 domain-containing protein [Chloroflexota bacterium]